jgi:choloylglycine hydrolase
MKKQTVLITCIALLGMMNLFSWQKAEACTRVVYQGPDGNIITARSMDWADEIPANLWIFPRGMERNGHTSHNTIQWTSKYGSIVASAFNIATADGMNEKGLVANVLWLAESQYPAFSPNGGPKGLALSVWAQYVLDNFASVNEAVQELQKEAFIIVTFNIPGTERLGTCHLSISDPSGDNAIFEYLDGKLHIHHDKAYNVMTNSPSFDEQLTLKNYWQSIPGTIMLPGTNRATDRFVRASYYIDAIPKTDNTRVAVASVFSVIRNCSVPFGISSDENPNISSTRWRSVADQKNKVYYFETALTPNTFWVDTKEIDFSQGKAVLKLPLEHFETYAGDALDYFVESAPFEFAGL